MATSRRELRIPTLGLAILMAFPWQLAFSAIERSAAESLLSASHRQIEVAPPPQWQSRSATTPTSLDCLMLVLDASEAEEEGNDFCPLDLTVAVALLEGAGFPTESRAAPLAIPAERIPSPHFVRFCLRC